MDILGYSVYSNHSQDESNDEEKREMGEEVNENRQTVDEKRGTRIEAEEEMLSKKLSEKLKKRRGSGERQLNK